MAFCKKCGKELKKGEKCSCETEVRFCKNCGKKLVGDEVCDCEKETATSTQTTGFDFVETMKNIKDDMLSSIKNPVSVVKENTDKINMPKTYIVLVLIALTFGLFIASLCKTLFATLVSTMMGSMSSLVKTSDIMDAIKIPYVKIIAYGAIIFAIMLFAYALVMLIVPAIFKNKKIDFKKSLTLTTAAYAPLAMVNLICAILGFLGLNAGFVLILFLIANMIVTYNFVYSYADYTKVDSNKFGYAITLLVILASIAVGICTYALSNSMVKSISQDIVDVDTDDLKDLLDY